MEGRPYQGEGRTIFASRIPFQPTAKSPVRYISAGVRAVHDGRGGYRGEPHPSTEPTSNRLNRLAVKAEKLAKDIAENAGKVGAAKRALPAVTFAIAALVARQAREDTRMRRRQKRQRELEHIAAAISRRAENE